MSEEIDAIRKIHQDPLFNETLEVLRSKGGYAAVAAAKAEGFIVSLLGGRDGNDRERFRFTRNGEHRIKNCRKVDLGCGYRIVCIQKGQRLALLYIGTHDDCFRWIDRHRTAEYDLDGVAEDAWKNTNIRLSRLSAVEDEENEKESFADAFEASLDERIDDAVLRKIFAGIVDSRS